MTVEIKLSDTAKALLIGAGETGFAAPTRIPPAALRSIAKSLEQQKLVRFVKPREGALQVRIDSENLSLKLTPAGRRAVGLEPEAKVAAMPERAPAAPRTDTKQARVIEMLRAGSGATVEQISAEMGWQAHTVRGFFAGLKKKGLDVQSQRVAKTETSGAHTVYSLPSA